MPVEPSRLNDVATFERQCDALAGKLIGGLNPKATHDALTTSESSQRDSTEKRFHDGSSFKAQQAPGAQRKRCPRRTTARVPRNSRHLLAIVGFEVTKSMSD